ncbi:MAG: hypothetical protein GY788_28395 [bacterium]|nr:hypothetical protein [bacterium]
MLDWIQTSGTSTHIDIAVAEPLSGGEVRYMGRIANDAVSLDRALSTGAT